MAPSPYVIKKTELPKELLAVQRELILLEHKEMSRFLVDDKEMVNIVHHVLSMDRELNGEGAYGDGDVRLCCKLPTKQIMEAIRAKVDQKKPTELDIIGVMVVACLKTVMQLNLPFPFPNFLAHKRDARRVLAEVVHAVFSKDFVRKRRIFAEAPALRKLITLLGGTPTTRSHAEIVVVESNLEKTTRSVSHKVRILFTKGKAKNRPAKYLCHYWHYPNSYDTWLPEEALENPPQGPYRRDQATSSLIIPDQLCVPVAYLYDSSEFNEFLEPEDYAYDTKSPLYTPLGNRCPYDSIAVFRVAQGAKRPAANLPAPAPKRRKMVVPDWYKPTIMSACEQSEFPYLEPLTYLFLREAIFESAEKKPDGEYFSAYDATTTVHGDANVVVKVHTFLEKSKLINNGVYKKPLPPIGGAAAIPLLYVDTPSGVFPYSKVKPLTDDEEKALIDAVMEHTVDSNVDWDKVSAKVGRGASECLQCFMDMDLEGTAQDDGEEGVLTPFADGNNRVLTTLAFLAAVAPPNEVKLAGEAALQELVEHCKDGLTEEAEELASAKALDVFRAHAERLVGVEENNLRILSRQAVTKLLQQAQLELDAFEKLEESLEYHRKELHEDRLKLDREESLLRQKILDRLKATEPAS
eukprot:TRINITY_DN11236_c0_g1_i1.p1 TRINITY_DN11236_c0_g1~~TRINITY_DN11236_c0_g1_i1.p1  ORF type:complete len:636 (+),score=152.94 TRINITY_DN11236_c0_g1_i1:40-1947(+)